MLTFKRISSHVYLKIKYSPNCRYAVISTGSFTIAGLTASFFSLSPMGLVFFIFTSIVSAYFSYGDTIKQQTSALLLGLLITLIVCSITEITSHLIIISFLVLIIISAISYFYSLINIGALYIVKFSFVIMAFAVTQSLEQNPIMISEMIKAIALGVCCCLISNTAYYFLITNTLKKTFITEWEQALISNLRILSLVNNYANTIDLNNIYEDKKNLYSKLPYEEQGIIDRITIALTKYQDLISSHLPTESQQIALTAFFEHLHEGVLNLSEHSIHQTNERFIQSVVQNIQEDNFVFLEIIYLLDKLSNNLIQYIKIRTIFHTSSYQQTPLVSLFFEKIRDQTLLNNNKTLTTNTKIATRAMIAIPLAYLVAIVIKTSHPAWVILSTNIVLLVRYGDTIKKSWDRILGHTIGFILTIPLFLYVWPYFNSPLVWAPILVFTITYYLLKNYMIFSTLLMIGIMYYVIITSPLHYTLLQLFHLSMDRWLDITIGCLVALVASLCVFHKAGSKQLIESYKKIMNNIDNLLKNIIDQSSNNTQLLLKNQLMNQLEKNKAIYLSISHEPEYYMKHKKTHAIITQFEKTISAQIASLILRLTAPQAHSTLRHTLHLHNISHIRIIYTLVQSITTNNTITPQPLTAVHTQIANDLLKTLQQDERNYLLSIKNHPHEYSTYIFFIGINHILRDITITLKHHVEYYAHDKIGSIR